MARELGVRPRTYSIGFTNLTSSEHRAARRIAAHLGTDHHELLVGPTAVELLPAVVAALDEPKGDTPGPPGDLRSRGAGLDVTGAPSRDGGGESRGAHGRPHEERSGRG